MKHGSLNKLILNNKIKKYFMKNEKKTLHKILFQLIKF
jgi:hypothetical protein